MTSFADGYDAPFINVYYLKKGKTDKESVFKPLEFPVIELDYKYAEGEDDEAIITIETYDKTIADRPEFQEGAALKVIWGYLNGRRSTARIVQVRDYDFEGDGVIKFKITCAAKAALLKDSYSKEIHGDGKKSFNWWTVACAICRKHGLALHFGDINVDFRRNPNPQIPNLPFYIEDKFLTYDWYPQASKSDYQLLAELLTSQPEGPYSITGRDESVVVGNRNLTSKPVRSYTYEGGSGELIKFTIKAKNQLGESESKGTIVTMWDQENKTFVSVPATDDKTPSGKTNEATRIGAIETGVSAALTTATFIKIAMKLLSKAPTLVPEIEIGTVGAESAAMGAVDAIAEGSVLTAGETFGLSLLVGGAAIGFYYMYYEIGPGWQVEPGLQFQIDSKEGVVKQRWKGEDGKVWMRIGKPKMAETQDYSKYSFGDPSLTQEQKDRYIQTELENYGGKDDPNFTTTIKEDTLTEDFIKKVENSYIDITKLPSFVGQVFNSLGLTTRYSTAGSREGAMAEAQNKKREDALNNIKATATLVGDPMIEDKQIITLLGIGKKYSGNYYIKKCKHKISTHSGYVIEIEDMGANSIGKVPENSNTIDNKKLPGKINIIIGDESIIEPPKVILPRHDGNHAYADTPTDVNY